jgi:hypothetical protein
MNNLNPTFIYLTREDYHQHIAWQSTLQDKISLNASLSKYPIENAFMNGNIPLSDLKCGVYGMTHPERLHTTCEGCKKYIFKSLLDTITNCTKGNALISKIELLHYTLYFEWSRNSERVKPQSAGRNGLMNHSKVTRLERRGNLFCLLCLCHTEAIKPKLSEKLREHLISINKLYKCLKLYCPMEEWFHESNLKEEVLAS